MSMNYDLNNEKGIAFNELVYESLMTNVTENIA